MLEYLDAAAEQAICPISERCTPPGSGLDCDISPLLTAEQVCTAALVQRVRELTAPDGGARVSFRGTRRYAELGYSLIELGLNAEDATIASCAFQDADSLLQLAVDNSFRHSEQWFRSLWTKRSIPLFVDRRFVAEHLATARASAQAISGVNLHDLLSCLESGTNNPRWRNNLNGLLIEGYMPGYCYAKM